MPNGHINELLSATGFAKVLVTLNPGVSRASGAAGAALAAPSVETKIQDYFVVPDQAQIMALGASASNAASRKVKKERSLETHPVRVYPHLGLALGYVNRKGAEGLRKDNRVAHIAAAPELSLIRPARSRSARLLAKPTWGIVRLQIPALWSAGIRGKGVVVGHLDTGVDGRHPALAKAVSKFAEFDLAGDEVPGAKPHDSGEHGTHTAGTIAGRPGAKGAAFGVAPEATLASAMVIEGGQVIDRVLAGMEWIVAQNIRILSMSLGLRGFTPAFQTVVNALRNANVLPIFAAGNEGPNSSRSPGNYDNVLSIGAFDASDNVADFSSSQAFQRPTDPLVPDLVAPGVDILSCIPNGKFAKMDGTSMATPHMAGFAALLLSAKPSASASELEAAILASCVRLASMPSVRANRGAPSAVTALEKLTGRALAKA